MESLCYVKRHPQAASCYVEAEVLTSENVSVDGRIVSRSIYMVDVPKSRFVGLSCNDYALENLLAAGVELKECHMSTNDFLATAHVLSDLSSLNVAVEQLKPDK